MTPDSAGSIEHLDFTSVCMLTNPGAKTDCNEAARWIVTVHAHTAQMERITVCDKHVAIFAQMEAELSVARTARCVLCGQVLAPGDVMRDVEVL